MTCWPSDEGGLQESTGRAAKPSYPRYPSRTIRTFRSWASVTVRVSQPLHRATVEKSQVREHLLVCRFAAGRTHYHSGLLQLVAGLPFDAIVTGAPQRRLAGGVGRRQ